MNDETIHSGAPSVSDDSVGYDPTTETFHARFDGGTETVTLAVVETVATVTDCRLVSMTPLFETVDPEALSALVSSPRDQSIEVSFPYEGCHVTVSNDGSVVVEPPET
jgi:hypothetical protein